MRCFSLSDSRVALGALVAVSITSACAPTGDLGDDPACVAGCDKGDDGHATAGGRWLAPLNADGSPPARADAEAVWTGTHLLVWGGREHTTAGLTTGGLYDLTTNRWQPMRLAGAPSLYNPGVVWAGDRLLVRGGRELPDFAPSTALHEYVPATDTWRRRDDAATAPPHRYKESITWTGHELIVWGGMEPEGKTATAGGWRFDPASDTWTPISPLGQPSARWGHAGLWTGREVLVFGGAGSSGGGDAAMQGGLYDPATDTWRAFFEEPVAIEQAIWAGDRAFVWDIFGGAWTFQPDLDRWTSLALPEAIDGRVGVSLVWTGHHVVVWGGRSDPNSDAQAGALYDPVHDTWTAMSKDGVPDGRARHMAVWTGTEMLVWGGVDRVGDGMQTGGRYVVE